MNTTAALGNRYDTGYYLAIGREHAMFRNVIHATHPQMMAQASTTSLREHYLLSELFLPDTVTLDYLHYERFIVGGAAPLTRPIALPAQEAPVRGEPFLARRELGIVNVGGPGRVLA